MTIDHSKCEHPDFNAWVEVSRMEDTGRFQADIKIACSVCKKPFRFLGLPGGVDFNGATVDIEGTTACMGIAPEDEVLNILEGSPTGFTVRRIV